MKLSLAHFLSNKSLSVLLLCAVLLTVFRMSNVSDKETSWDVLGYYLPLPATFIYEDPLMENRQWIEEINEEKNLTGTLYQISSTPDGKPMYFFLLGMAMLFLPFFLLGHASAYLFDYPMDGFSIPYQYAMVVGGLFYTILGLIYLRKILLRFIPDSIAAIVLVIIVFGTNYSHHLSLKNLETVNVLFLFVTLVIWNTIKWHQNQKLKNLLAIGASITLMSMVKPSEILIALIPVFYGVYSLSSAKEKMKLIKQYKIQFLWMILLCFFLASPQMMYWYIRTGHLFYDSYINPGVGLDVLSPYVFESLFSYKKGWFVYTPVMILSLIGFYFLVKRHPKIAFSLICYFVVTAYIIFSWTEWWYGAGFSNRPLITTYPILAITLGLFLTHLSNAKKGIKYGVIIFVGLCILLNQFQWWQLRNGILEPYRTTKEYYWASFMKTSVTPEDKKLLSVYRDFDGEHSFENKDEYVLILDSTYTKSENEGYTITPETEYLPVLEKSFSSYTQSDHLWVEVAILSTIVDSTQSNMPLIVATMERKEGAYGYYTKRIESNYGTNKGFSNFTLHYLTPNLRNRDDRLKIYCWNKDKATMEIAQINIKLYERK